MTTESLSAADKIIQATLNHVEHLYHNRPGLVRQDGRTAIGVSWTFVSHKVEDGQKIVYSVPAKGSRQKPARLGVMGEDSIVRENGAVVGRYQPAGFLPEAAAWIYSKIAEVWQSDNEFAARWASYAYAQDHKDTKVALCAFMLVQSRKGDPIRDGDKIALHDEDFREVGEAMALIVPKDKKDGEMSPKLLLRVHELLTLPVIAEMNRKLGFTTSARNPAVGRWPRVVQKWLEYREDNEKLLQGLVKAGYQSTVKDLARKSGYKPKSERFYSILRWKQHPAKDGRRSIAIGKEVAAAETWEGLTEAQVCEKIVAERPDFKRITSLVPRLVGMSKAVVSAAVEANCLSGKDLIIMMPTLEALGLLQDKDVRAKVDSAVRAAEDMRAANIASRLRSKEAKDLAAEASDAAVKKAVAQASKAIRTYVVVDISASMQGAIEAAKSYLAKFVQGLPLERTHVSVFNGMGREIKVKIASAVGVEAAFRGVQANGSTNYGEGVRCLQHYKPADDEDVLMIFVGDERNHDQVDRPFDDYVRASGLRPAAFGLIRTPETSPGQAVRSTAARLGIPCFEIKSDTFGDPYAVPRVLRALMESTPIATPGARPVAAKRETLAEIIKKTDLLRRPAWAA